MKISRNFGTSARKYEKHNLESKKKRKEEIDKNRKIEKKEKMEEVGKS